MHHIERSMFLQISLVFGCSRSCVLGGEVTHKFKVWICVPSHRECSRIFSTTFPSRVGGSSSHFSRNVIGIIFICDLRSVKKIMPILFKKGFLEFHEIMKLYILSGSSTKTIYRPGLPKVALKILVRKTFDATKQQMRQKITVHLLLPNKHWRLI